MVTSFDISQEIFSMDILAALKSSLKHRRKHVLRSFQLYGDQALATCSLSIVRTLREDQRLRLLLNFLFYHFNYSEPTYKSQRIKILDIIAACNQLNVNALN